MVEIVMLKVLHNDSTSAISWLLAAFFAAVELPEPREPHLLTALLYNAQTSPFS